MKAILGLSRDHVPSPYEFERRLHPDDREPTATALQRHLYERTPYDIEYRLRKQDGDYVWLRATAQAAWDAQGNPIRIIGSIDDISHRKDAESKLHALNQSLEAQVVAKAAQLKTIIDAMPNMVGYWDHELRCRFANPAYLRWFDRCKPADMLGQTMQSVLGDELFAKNEPFMRAALKGERRSFERWHTRPDGTTACTWITYVPDQAPGGEVNGVFVVVTDITPILQANQKAKQSDARYRMLADNSSDMVVQLDRDLVRRYVSPACREVLGYEEGDLLDKAHLQVIHPDDVARFRQACAQLLDGVAEQCQTILRKRHRDGHWLWIETAMRAYRDPATGQISGIVKALRDISARKAVEDLLTQRTEQLEATNQELQGFAFAAAHDIRSPLRAIGNAATWLEEDLDPYLNAETRGHFTRLRDRVIRLQNLLDDLLEFSRIGREGGRNQIISGTELIDNVLALLPEVAGFEVTACGFAAIRIARMPLQQILMNLIGNAIKHHHKNSGRIEISAEDVGGQFAFAVKDDGPGIPARFHAQIFKMFETLKPRDQVEGSGMGLAIVRKQIELAGGSLALESTEGQGSVFRFTLPALQPDQVRAIVRG
jgi:PAS domain S-box-containing protein